MEDYYQQNSERPRNDVPKRYFTGAVAAALVVAAFIGGVAVGELRSAEAERGTEVTQLVGVGGEQPGTVSREVDFGQFWDVWDLVLSRHVEQPVDEVEMFYGAIAGMVGSLEDPYSVYLDPHFAEMFESELAGTFEGIGAEIGIKQDQLKIIAPLPNTPAERAGLKAGDAILAIDEVDTYNMSTDEAVRRIRGPKGEEVILLIGREGEEPQDVPIVRDTIKIESVRWRTEERDGARLAVIEIFHFNEATMPLFEEAIQRLVIENPDGLILDLRNNPGGFLDTAVDVAGEWVQQDVVVQEKFSDGSIRNYTSNGTARLADIPTVVLVNGGSASASEIVAGALQHYGKATVVGEPTFGKGSVQDYVEFDDGSALKLTIALWLTPAGQSIEKEGITPDQLVEMSVEDFNNDLDPQLDQAFELLNPNQEQPE
jgi:carboxyl-terminal processing protease